MRKSVRGFPLKFRSKPLKLDRDELDWSKPDSSRSRHYGVLRAAKYAASAAISSSDSREAMLRMT
jgi:hypothetical protein